MREIALTQGKVALVDNEDFDYLNQFKWKASKIGKNWYAMRDCYLGTENGKKKKKSLYMHRVIAERSGMDVSNLIDHINRNSLDNQQKNLRPATHKQNKENVGLYSHNSSGYSGVSWHQPTQSWRARVKHNQKEIYLGLFKNIEDAVKARKEAEEKYFTHAT